MDLGCGNGVVEEHLFPRTVRQWLGDIFPSAFHSAPPIQYSHTLYILVFKYTAGFFGRAPLAEAESLPNERTGTNSSAVKLDQNSVKLTRSVVFMKGE